MKNYLIFISLFCMKIVSSYNPSFSGSLIHGQFFNDHRDHGVSITTKNNLVRNQIRNHFMKNQSMIDNLLKTATDAKLNNIPPYRRTFKLAGHDYSLQEILDAHNKEDPIMQEIVDKLITTMEKEEIPMISDKNSSKLDLNRLCGVAGCINRDFYEYSSMLASSQSTSDSASKFAESLLKHIHKSILISGDKRSGKSVTLAKILRQLRASVIPNWSFILDMAEAVPTPIPSNWQPENILSSVFDDEQTAHFKNLLVRQPWSVYILVDNIDRVPADATDRLLEYFKNLNLNGTGIIMTSTQRFMQPVLSGQGQVSVRIRDLSTQDIENLLVKLWTVEFSSSAEEKISDYAKAVADALLKTSIPRSIGTIKQLGKLLLAGDNKIFYSEEDFISVKQYINDGTLKLRDIVNVFDIMKVNKLQLFDNLTETSDYLNEFYGQHALTGLLHYNSNNYKLLKSLRREGDLWYTDDKTQIEPLLQRLSNDITTFFHPEHKNYFAAKYIIHHIKSHSNPLVHITKLILEHSKYFAVAEYLNAAIAIHGSKLLKPVFEHITRNSDSLHKILDNAITYGLDEIASGLFKEVNNVRDIQAYFHNEPKHASISSSVAYKFGMLFNTYTPVVSNRQEMLFRKNMQETVETLTTIDNNRNVNERSMWILMDFPSYLKYGVLSQRKPNIKLYTFIMDHLAGIKSTEFYNELMFRVVKYALWNSRNIAVDLQARGATPWTINVNGETLVHLALKNLNLNMLKFIVEQLKVPIKETPTIKSFLITILDANPLNQYSSPQFWETMEYLIENGEFNVPQPSDVSKLDGSTDVNNANMMSTGYDLVAGTEDLATFGKIISKLRLSSRPFENLSSDERSYRRNLVLLRKSASFQLNKLGKTTLTEVLLKFRGLDILTRPEEAAYERSIYAAFKFDTRNGRVSSQQVSRIVTAFVENVASTEDLNFAKTFSQRMLMKRNKKQASKLLNLMDSRMQTLISSPFDKYVTKGAMQTRAELQHPPIAWFQPNFEIISKHSAKSSNHKLRRSRRETVKCLVDENEYKEAVKTIEENGQKTRTLNSDKFIELMGKDNGESRIRQEQLKDLARRLFNDKSTTVIGNEAELKKMVYGDDIPTILQAETISSIAPPSDNRQILPPQDPNVPSTSRLTPYEISFASMEKQLPAAVEPVSDFGQINREMLLQDPSVPLTSGSPSSSELPAVSMQKQFPAVEPVSHLGQINREILLQDPSVPLTSGSPSSSELPAVSMQKQFPAVEPVSHLGQINRKMLLQDPSVPSTSINNGNLNIEAVSNSNEHDKFSSNVDPSISGINVVDDVNILPDLINHEMNGHDSDAWLDGLGLGDLSENHFNKIDDVIRNSDILRNDNPRSPVTLADIDDFLADHADEIPNEGRDPTIGAQSSNHPTFPDNVQNPVPGHSNPGIDMQPTVRLGLPADGGKSPGELLELEMKRLATEVFPDNPSTLRNHKRQRMLSPWQTSAGNSHQSDGFIGYQTDPSSTITQPNIQNNMLYSSDHHAAYSNPTSHANPEPIPQQWSQGFEDPLILSPSQQQNIQQMPGMGNSLGTDSYQLPNLASLPQPPQGIPMEYNVPVGPTNPIVHNPYPNIPNFGNHYGNNLGHFGNIPMPTQGVSVPYHGLNQPMPPVTHSSPLEVMHNYNYNYKPTWNAPKSLPMSVPHYNARG